MNLWINSLDFDIIMLMKTRLVLIFLMFSLATTLCFAQSSDMDYRTQAMGCISPSGIGSHLTFFSNPSSLFFYNQKSKFLINSSYLDNRTKGSGHFMDNPDLIIKMQFVGKGISLGLGVDSYIASFSAHPEKEDTRVAITNRRFDLDFSFAFGYKYVAIGAGVNVGSFSQKPNVEIPNGKTFSSFMTKAFFSNHTRLHSSEYIDIRLGIMANIKQFSLSVTSSKLMTYQGLGQSMTFNQALKTLGAGLYFNQDMYGRRGRLNTWVCSCGFEIKNICDDDNRTINGGVEVLLQLAKNRNIAFRTGYYAKPSSLFSEGCFTFGLGLRLGKFDVSAYTELPTLLFKGEQNNYKVGIGFTFLI